MATNFASSSSVGFEQPIQLVHSRVPVGAGAGVVVVTGDGGGGGGGGGGGDTATAVAAAAAAAAVTCSGLKSERCPSCFFSLSPLRSRGRKKEGGGLFGLGLGRKQVAFFSKVFLDS